VGRWGWESGRTARPCACHRENEACARRPRGDLRGLAATALVVQAPTTLHMSGSAGIPLLRNAFRLRLVPSTFGTDRCVPIQLIIGFDRYSQRGLWLLGLCRLVHSPRRRCITGQPSPSAGGYMVASDRHQPENSRTTPRWPQGTNAVTARRSGQLLWRTRDAAQTPSPFGLAIEHGPR